MLTCSQCGIRIIVLQCVLTACSERLYEPLLRLHMPWPSVIIMLYYNYYNYLTAVCSHGAAACVQCVCPSSSGVCWLGPGARPVRCRTVEQS